MNTGDTGAAGGDMWICQAHTPKASAAKARKAEGFMQKRWLDRINCLYESASIWMTDVASCSHFPACGGLLLRAKHLFVAARLRRLGSTLQARM